MGHVIGILLNILLLAGFLAAGAWIIFTKKIAKRLGVLKFLVLTIIWNGILFANYIFIWKMSSLPIVFMTSPVGWIEKIADLIYAAYYMLMTYVFPAYTILVMIYVGVYYISRRKRIS